MNRINLIAKCASVSGAVLHRLDYQKANSIKYFMEVYSHYVPIEHDWGWMMEARPLEPHSCYYLGNYPWYFNYLNMKPVPADDLGTADAFPMGAIPMIPNFLSKYSISTKPDYTRYRGQPFVEYIASELQNRPDELAFFYGKLASDAYFAQQFWFADRTRKYYQCAWTNYGEKSPTPEEEKTTTEVQQVDEPPPTETPEEKPGETPGEKLSLTLTGNQEIGTMIQTLTGEITIALKQ